jgi:hypothetical protein
MPLYTGTRDYCNGHNRDAARQGIPACSLMNDSVASREIYFPRNRAMTAVEQTLEQILQAVRRLPEAQREKLLKEIEALPKPEQARATARRLRARYRLGRKPQQRMSDLLAKGNAGTLSREEKQELGVLVADFEKRTLEFARAIAEAVDQPSI